MRVNVYAEEMTDRIQIIAKEIEGQTFTGLRFYLELPCTVPIQRATPNGETAEPQLVTMRGPFMHHPGDDDSAAVTFWGKSDLRDVLRKALAALDKHYGDGPATKAMVDRFLSWQLPKDFNPDCHISFKLPDPILNPNPTWPVGTNLLTADQARGMLDHVLGG
jgi:hypothetical protein